MERQFLTDFLFMYNTTNSIKILEEHMGCKFKWYQRLQLKCIIFKNRLKYRLQKYWNFNVLKHKN